MRRAIIRVLRSSALRPVRNLIRPLAARWGVPVGAVLPFGYTCYVDLRSALGRGLLVTGHHEPALEELIAATMTSGGVFIDVGANVGYFSLLALSRAGSGGEAHAFEFNPLMTRLLRITKQKGGVDNLFIYPNALGDSEGLVGMVELAERNWNHVDLSPAGPATLRMCRLDSWESSFAAKRVELIKIDVEGMELKVLSGAREILKAHKPVVVCEAVPENLARFGGTPAALVEFMGGLGYSARELGGAHDPNLVFTP